jgi:hypothetical protein
MLTKKLITNYYVIILLSKIFQENTNLNDR